MEYVSEIVYSCINYNVLLQFSEHAGYSGGQIRDYSEYSSGSSYRDTYESYGKSPIFT